MKKTKLFIENILRKNGRQTDDTVLENVLNQLNELKGIEQYENNIVWMGACSPVGSNVYKPDDQN